MLYFLTIALKDNLLLEHDVLHSGVVNFFPYESKHIFRYPTLTQFCMMTIVGKIIFLLGF